MMHYNSGMQNDKQFTMRIPAELYDEIEALSKRLGRSKAEVARTALEAGVAEGKLIAGVIANPLVKSLLQAVLRSKSDPEQLELFERALKSGTVPPEITEQ